MTLSRRPRGIAGIVALLLAGLAAVHASSTVVVDVETPWLETSALMEASEHVAHETADGFWDFVQATASMDFSGMTDQEAFQHIRKEAAKVSPVLSSPPDSLQLAEVPCAARHTPHPRMLTSPPLVIPLSCWPIPSGAATGRVGPV